MITCLPNEEGEFLGRTMCPGPDKNCVTQRVTDADPGNENFKKYGLDKIPIY